MIVPAVDHRIYLLIDRCFIFGTILSEDGTAYKQAANCCGYCFHSRVFSCESAIIAKQRQEPVSEPSEDDHEAGQFSETVEEKRVDFVAGDQTAEGLEPANR